MGKRHRGTNSVPVPDQAQDAPEGDRSLDELLPLYYARTAKIVDLVRRARSVRSDFFRSDLFGEPAWDILLDLYQSELAQRRVAVNAVCVGSGVAPTTAIRWLQTLENEGLVRRTPDPMDGRRVFVSLTDAALRRLDRLFGALDETFSELHRR
jgi:DNA-binding MarR family transcriptional regulator